MQPEQSRNTLDSGSPLRIALPDPMGHANLTTFCRAVRGRRAAATHAGSPLVSTRVRETGRSAVRLLHDQGPARADAYLAETWTTGAGLPSTALAVHAAAVTGAFERYKRLNLADGRPARGLGLRRQVAAGGHSVDVRIDVVLHDHADCVVPRMLLWDLGTCGPGEAETIASLGLVACDMAYGRGTVRAVQVWQLRALAAHTVTATAARDATPRAAAVLAKVAV
jgi:hypothetical protein